LAQASILELSVLAEKGAMTPLSRHDLQEELRSFGAGLEVTLEATLRSLLLQPATVAPAAVAPGTNGPTTPTTSLQTSKQMQALSCSLPFGGAGSPDEARGEEPHEWMRHNFQSFMAGTELRSGTLSSTKPREGRNSWQRATPRNSMTPSRGNFRRSGSLCDDDHKVRQTDTEEEIESFDLNEDGGEARQNLKGRLSKGGRASAWEPKMVVARGLQCKPLPPMLSDQPQAPPLREAAQLPGAVREDEEEEESVIWERLAAMSLPTRDNSRHMFNESQDVVDMSASLPEEKSCSSVVSKFVRSPQFDYISGGLVIINAISLGVQIDWQARHVTDETTLPFRVLETVFCSIFTVELLLRLFAFRWAFFRRPHVQWNLFDCLLVFSQLAEEILSAMAKDGSSSTGVTANFSIMRMMRILRLIRVMRLMRILRLIGELRTMLLSILGSLKSLLWAVILLFLMMYIIGVYITQLVLDKRVSLPEKEDVTQTLIDDFGSLGDAILSLYQAVTGGTDWGDFLDPLRSEISLIVVPCFMLYIAFVLLCMLNVITGVFVESALLNAKHDKNVYMINHIRHLFSDTKLCTESGEISWDGFVCKLDTLEMQEIFKEIDIDISEAKGLFKLLDTDESNSIDVAEFINGFTRLRGPAKSLDLQLLMREMMRLSQRHSEFSREVERYLACIPHMVRILEPLRSKQGRIETHFESEV